VITSPGRNCLGVYDVRETGVLIDARTYYRALYDCARKARRYILISGWQFDSEVSLLRGKDAEGADTDVKLLPFLNSLCSRNADLHIYILAWDFSVIFSLDREWFQDLIFRWMTNKRIHFIFDGKHAIGASHHQKLVVIDGLLAFVGGMDICANRWDDARHLPADTRRTDPGGDTYGPYHDIQSYHVGPIAAQLAELFLRRWVNAGGDAIDLPAVSPDVDFTINSAQVLSSRRVSVSRTQARNFTPFFEEPVQEIRNLYIDAIAAAEKLVYIENQYFSSRAVYDALQDRMNSPGRSRIEIVIILPEKPEALLEQISLGMAQAKMLRFLKETADRRDHSLGIYYTVALSAEDFSPATYIHSKLLLVDDRFLTVGSANTTNRSMGLDTELNVSWEAAPNDDKLIRSIRNVRTSLLAEHTGIRAMKDIRRLARTEELVHYLNSISKEKTCRLRVHTTETLIREVDWMNKLGVDDFSLDPEKPIVEENVYELLTKDSKGFFSNGIGILQSWLQSKLQERAGSWDSP